MVLESIPARGSADSLLRAFRNERRRADNAVHTCQAKRDTY
jgi:hypothetical protein